MALTVRDLLPENETARPTAVYRFFDASDRLLYVGMTSNPRTRWAMHAADKSWWSEVVRQTTDWYSTRAEAATAEAAAIRTENPMHNISGTPKMSERMAAGFERRQKRIEDELLGHVEGHAVRAKRAGKYWELHVKGVGVTQARNLGRDADEMIRHYVATTTGAAQEAVSYTLFPEVGDELDAITAEARQASREAEAAVSEAAAANRAVARKMQAMGIKGRDIAHILGVTPQRVSQLLSDKVDA